MVMASKRGKAIHPVMGRHMNISMDHMGYFFSAEKIIVKFNLTLKINGKLIN
jgi:hypothetical protein